MKMNKKGFTLVELLVVVGILVLLAGVGIPQYFKVQQRAEDALRLAKAQAAVTAFLAEVGYDSGVLPKEEDVLIALSTLKGTSMLTGKTISFLGDYWNEADGQLNDLVVDHKGEVSFGTPTPTNTETGSGTDD
jgi:type IV pilus assembly protein PilA